MSQIRLNSRWLCEEDVERDLYEYSNLSYPVDKSACTPPKSIAEYRARTASKVSGGLFDEDNDAPAVFVSGRGKYIKDRVVKPGLPMPYVREDEMKIKKKLREVSGLGYGNEIIERAFKLSNGVNTNHEEEISLPDLRLHSLTPKSSKTTPSYSPTEMETNTPKK